MWGVRRGSGWSCLLGSGVRWAAGPRGAGWSGGHRAGLLLIGLRDGGDPNLLPPWLFDGSFRTETIRGGGR